MSNQAIEIDFSDLPRIINDIYYPTLMNKSRYLVLYGGAGSGKSVFIAQKIIFRMITEDKHRFLVVRKVAKTIRNSVFALFKDVISQWGLAHLFTVNKSDFRITCNLNGNEIICAGLDDPEKIKSITGITSIWIEEASEFEQADFNQLDLRLRGFTNNYKQIMISFNPISALHWLKAEFFDTEKQSTTVIHSTYKDNKFIDDEYRAVLENLQYTDPTYYNIYCLGHWGTTGNLVFTNYKIHEFDKDLSNFGSVYHGLDWGWNDPTAYVRIALKDDELYVLEEFYESEVTNTELIQRLNDIHNKKHQLIADSSEPARIKEFKNHGYNIDSVKKGPGSIKAGLDFMRGKKIHIHPSCINFKKEIMMYKYREDKNGKPTEEPVDFMNHLMDAARYALTPLTKHKKPLKAIKTLA